MLKTNFNLPSNQKIVKISSKGQITLPKAFLTKIGLDNGQNILVQLANNRIEIINEQKNNINKLQKFKPISIGGIVKVNFSGEHNEIYD